jgi:hypothetical protein
MASRIVQSISLGWKFKSANVRLCLTKRRHALFQLIRLYKITHWINNAVVKYVLNFGSLEEHMHFILCKLFNTYLIT